MTASATIERLIDVARWAPSGDNTQPWRFEALDERHFVVHGFDTRDWCLYDIDGRPSQLALGALLENIRIAAHSQHMSAEVTRRRGAPDERPTFDVRLRDAPDAVPDTLAAFIERRSVQRRPLRARPLTPAMRDALANAVGPGHFVQWFEGWNNRLKVALLMFHYSKLRLCSPEAYRVHRDVIAWHSRFSDDKVPDAAIGLDPMTTRLMAWVMQDWKRVEFMNRYLAGTWIPRIQLDLIPGLACAAHFAIVARVAPTSIDDYVAAGAATQRFWLTATQLGLQLQPEMTPVIFSAYVRQGRDFSAVAALANRSRTLAQRFDALLGPDAGATVFFGRVGIGPQARARSQRLPVTELMSARRSDDVDVTRNVETSGS